MLKQKPDKVLSRRQVCAIFGDKSQTWVYARERAGDLHPVYVGNRAYYRLADVERLAGGPVEVPSVESLRDARKARLAMLRGNG